MTTITTHFELVRDTYVPEINSHARFYRHSKTGTEVLSLENSDENKVFGIAFRTPAHDSTGVAHILEHSVLCGSRKYPLKEPFVELIKGSLNTFLNAFTYPDKTCYPVASQNTQDLYNLIDVYLDAVFYPRITRHIFEQEGWHYELDSLDQPLIYKGVVFNEMKGAYGAPDRALAEYAQQSLYPDHPYGFDSGGHSRFIPDLTYEQFVAFHRTYYHPSNARIFFYGDDDPQKRLEIIDAYLNAFEPIQPHSAVPLQPSFNQPRHSTHSYRVDEGEANNKQTMVSVNWMLPENNNPELVLALNMLDHILVGTSASPLRKALIDSGLGEDLTHAGFADELRQGMFSVGLKGIQEADAPQVEALILETLEQLAREGIDPATLEAALNTTEFHLREQNTGSAPRGLVIMVRALNTWLHGDDPLAPLSFEAPLAAIKQRLEAGEPVFEKLIRELLLENRHRTTVVLRPDPEYGKQEDEAERQRLEQVRAGMDEAALQGIIENTRELRALQERPDSPEALATIPHLTLDDLDKAGKTIPVELLERESTRVLYHDLPTNGIVYLDLALNLHLLPQELIPYGDLFGRLLLDMGTEQEDFVSLSQRIGRKTGGISARPMSSMIQHPGSGDTPAAVWLILRGKATRDHVPDLLAILNDVLLTARLDDRERFRQIVLEEKASLESAISPAGHRIVGAYLRAHFNEADWASEQMGGISHLFFLRRLLQEIDESWSIVRDRLEIIRRTLVTRQGMVCNVTSEAADWQQTAAHLDSFLAGVPNTAAAIAHWSPQYGSGFEGLTIPSQVNYVGKAASLYTLGYSMHGSVLPVLKYLNTTWIWEQVRVMGGAYGGFVRFDRQSGVLDYLSYRDPNLLKTLDVYNGTGAFLRQANISASEVTKSIIGTIGAIDAYQLPDAKGYTSLVRHLINQSDADRQQVRDQVLATTAADFRAFADVLDAVRDQGIVAVISSAEQIEAANQERPGFLKRIKVL